MSLKIIVKRNWLPIGGLPARDRASLERLVMLGELRRVAELPREAQRKLPPAAQAFLVEKSVQVQGNPAQLARLLEALPQEPPRAKQDLALWEERVFLKAFALSRLGREAEAGPLFQALPYRFQPLAQMERALVRLNQGDLAGAEAMFLAVLGAGGEGLDPYSLCSLLGGLSLARIHQGDFRGAELCLHERRKLLKQTRAPVLEFGTRLYEILLLLEKNEFPAAARWIDRSLSEVDPGSVNGFFLLHLRLQLLLARNELAQAGAVLRELEARSRELKLPDGVLGYRLEEIEWNVRSGDLARAGALMAAVEEEAKRSRDDFLLFRLLLLKAQALVREGKAAEALAAAGNAVDLGELRHYRPGLVWALFHAAGVALAAGQSLQARLFLQRGRRLAGELRLPVRLAALSYMAEVLESRYASASALLGLAKHREMGPELEYFLGTYRLLDSVSLRVQDGHSQSVVNEPALRRKLFQDPGLFWFQKEAVLLANPGSGEVATVEFTPRSPLLAAFRLFWSSFQSGLPGFTLREVHKARLSCPYREELHAGAAKMLVSRLRQQLARSGIAVVYERESGLYRFVAELPAFTIQSNFAPEPGPAAGKKSRELVLLERIAMEPFVSTQALCREFGVSRQALHPWLKRLTEAGRVRLVKRGPVSGYIARGRS